MKKYPQVIRADIMGYCMGVRRAVEMVENAVAAYHGRRVYTFGPLIHNQTALESLAAKGVGILNEDSVSGGISADAEGAVVLLRAHGVPPSVKSALLRAGCTVIDATCPRVLANQRQAAAFSEKGYGIIIAGERDHGEVLGIAGYAERHVILGSAADAYEFIHSAGQRLDGKSVLIGQTTISRCEYNAVAAVLEPVMPNLRILNTICPATEERQQALRALPGRADGILVVGGRHSANTRRLFAAAGGYFDRAELIETADEIPDCFFDMDCVALTAGASTPDSVIERVEQALKGLCGCVRGSRVVIE